jgi:outer membrane murein-binding lipoprotein Lpp
MSAPVPLSPETNPLFQYCAQLEESNNLLKHNSNWSMHELSNRVNQSLELSNEVQSLGIKCDRLSSEFNSSREELKLSREENAHLSSRLIGTEAMCAELSSELECAEMRCAELSSELECESEAHMHTRSRLLAIESVTNTVNLAILRVMKKKLDSRDDSLVKLVQEKKKLSIQVKQTQRISDTTGVLLANALKERDDALVRVSQLEMELERVKKEQFNYMNNVLSATEKLQNVAVAIMEK